MARLTVTERQTDADGLRPTQRAFLTALADTGSLIDAARRIGIDRTSHYDWLRAEGMLRVLQDDVDPPESAPYARAFLLAKRMGGDRILERAEAHALSDATDMPATINRIFHIKRWHPAYRDSLNVRHSGAVLSARVDLNQLDPTERADLLRLTQRRLLLLEQGDVAVGDDDQ